LLAASAILAAAVIQPASSFAANPAPDPELEELRAIEDLRARFERDAGKVRLVLLLSPT
jgi:hypothetical protein